MLIVGIGSILMGDDGAGIEVINRLGQIKLPENVELLNAGLDSFGLLGKLEGRKKVIIVDALRGGETGKVYTLSFEEIEKFEFMYSLHDFTIEHLIKTGQEIYSEFPEDIQIVGIGISDIEGGIGLSREVEKGVDIAVDVVLKEVRECV